MRQAGTDGDGSSTGPAKVPQLEEEGRPSSGRCEGDQGRNGRDSSRLSVQNPTTSGSELDVGHPLEVYGTSSGVSSMTSTESLSLPHPTEASADKHPDPTTEDCLSTNIIVCS